MILHAISAEVESIEILSSATLHFFIYIITATWLSWRANSNRQRRPIQYSSNFQVVSLAIRSSDKHSASYNQILGLKRRLHVQLGGIGHCSAKLASGACKFREISANADCRKTTAAVIKACLARNSSIRKRIRLTRRRWLPRISTDRCLMSIYDSIKPVDRVTIGPYRSLVRAAPNRSQPAAWHCNFEHELCPVCRSSTYIHTSILWIERLRGRLNDEGVSTCLILRF